MVVLLDLIVVCSYLVLMILIGIFSARGEHLSGFMVNQRRTSLWLLTFSNVSTIVGAGAVVGVASAAYSSGISYLIPTTCAALLGVIVLALMAPKVKEFGDTYKAFTLGDFFQHRFGSKHRTLSAVLLVCLMLIWGSVQFAAIAQLLKVLLGLDFSIAIAGSVVITILYTSMAGIKSDILTDFFQFWIIATMFVTLLPLTWIKAGGLSALLSLPPGHFDPVAFGGPAFLFGGLILGTFVFVANVSHWQRIYSADSVKTARRSFWLSVPFVVLFFLSSAVAGMLAATLLPGKTPDLVLFALMADVLPQGLLGLGYAGILAVAMSSIDSLLIGGSATILKDLYMPFFHPQMHEHELLNLARYLTALFGIASAAIAFIFNDIVVMSIVSASASLVFVPSILGGLFWKRTSSTAALWSIIIGSVALAVFIPVNPKIAFLPSFVIGTLVLWVGSLITKRTSYTA